MGTLLPAAVFVASMIGAFALTWLVLGLLRRRAILDHPNERSSHDTPTPRGGGIAVVAVLLAALVAVGTLGPAAPDGIWRVLGGVALLTALCWLDDLRGLGASVRLAVQAVAVALGLSGLPEGKLVLQGLVPLGADRVIALLAWIWFVNLFNFMDGIDGIAGAETVAVGLGLFLLALAGAIVPATGLIALACAGAALGFLWWNWHPARVFLGDVGSVPLGYLLGWLLIVTAADGAWAAALILPLYFLADATLTLARRLLRGERIWRAHREHIYQRAVQSGLSHAQVVRHVTAGNAALIGLAVVAAAGWRLAALGAAAVVVVLMLLLLLGRPPERTAR